MQRWINTPAPHDDCYELLSRKAERDADGWVVASGLAQHLATIVSPALHEQQSAQGPTAAAAAAALV
jgi:hypothetical protein